MCREPVVGHGWPMGVYLGSSYGFAALCHAMVNDPSKGPLVLHGYGVGCTATPTPTTGAWGVVGMGVGDGRWSRSIGTETRYLPLCTAVRYRSCSRERKFWLWVTARSFEVILMLG
ncbi:hypothetical protein CPAR01_01328 [Colletotrichum paranaense]|uniref:Uncharacterized protein n=4 Tax=Colletotrichum acutatum species complex TaxID=2707335 RepID=A0AAI9YZ39_9PEZI|nr:uncharacterized protein CCOS01_06757 [Colletotrichum costaricense]XP_060356474.1 uncharacterized protein CPAR01_01328 [Colletotrichum paranaense]XP_060387884.1 uncharacterized protein CTAM01_01381 [Colletotrichum tamarilloi]KAK1455168.1 hypothetical protein CMEL01_03928 [Colletotrichum melonis]KAK1510808.1 hypothetical protein CTAM01_01381 [Colletotrichum tamarilloi]KAK1528923.1 hypothetical protein CCOS01_06757 [Colletotrichum costaricense]KAK1547361.1 hypothetical protein CPAR01_01328 [C